MSPLRSTSRERFDLGANVSRLLRILMAVDLVDQRTVAAETGIDAAALSRSLRGQRRWQVDEIEVLAEYFDVAPAMFFEPVDRFLPLRDGDDDPGGASATIPFRRRSQQVTHTARCIREPLKAA